MLTIAVIERDYSIVDEEMRDRYIGSPCRSFEEARELCIAHGPWHSNFETMAYTEDGYKYASISQYTGEVLKEFFVKVL